ncbi:hypothetical protein GYMLUDRAFT_39407 [Collybiopsis luxurians FD-317 M1]|nr:hypothetical protein GYMLUDRAFT_39407 [Collybiopsis luxurians FD-317 M1]
MHAILCKLLPHFQQLFGVDLTTWTPKIDLLKSLHEHPTISAVMIYSSAYLPPLSSGVDLSKIVLVRLHLRSFHDDMGNSLPDGLIAHRLVVREDETMRLDEEFSRLAFNGLRELKIYIRGSVSFSWLPTFTLAHPHLHKLLLKDDDFNHFRCHPPSFIGSFVEESKRQGLDEHFELGRVGLTRGTIQSTHEWRVTLISIYINAAFMGFLSLISSSLPTIEILHLNLTTLNRTYHIDDVVPAFAGFSHLRVLSLPHIIDRLQFGREEPWQPVRQVNENNTLETHAAAAETALLWFTSRLAKQVPSLEAFFIKERGSIEQGNGNERSWYLVGWLHVVSGRRDVEGSLRLITDGGRSFTVKTGSRLLADEMGERG